MSAAFYPLKILDIVRETDDAISVTLAPAPEASGDFHFLPGQHLILRADLDGEDVRRNYSICVAPDGGPLKVGIRRIAGGRFSTWAMESWRPGDTIEAMTPRGTFTWAFAVEQTRSYLAFAAGSGITPILSLIRAGLEAEPNSRFTLLYGNRASNTIMFLEDIADLKDRYIERFQVYHFLGQEMDDVALFNGRLDAARIAEVLTSLVDPKAIDVAFICGPGAMMDAAESAMLRAGLAAEAVLSERFTTADLGAEASAAEQHANRESREQAQGLRMEVRIEGRRRAIAFDAEKGNILESARASGLPAPYACKAGVCATCRARLVSGEVHMRKNYGLSAEEVAQGYILTCQAIPKGEGVVVDYDG